LFVSVLISGARSFLHSIVVSEEPAFSAFRQSRSLYLSTTLHSHIPEDSNLHRHCHEKLKSLVKERRFFLKVVRYFEVTVIRALLDSKNVCVCHVFQWNVKVSDLLQLSLPSAIYLIFRRVRKIATNFVMSVCQSAWHNLAPTIRIFVKFYI
jgi:hypothetical protein